MTVRAKFKVDALEHTGGQKQADGKALVFTTVKMTPVYPKAENGKSENEHENRTFWNYTPSGELRLQTVNENAAKYFELGEEYYLDFVKVE